MIDAERVKRRSVEALKVLGLKPELSPQAAAVVDALVVEINAALSDRKPAKRSDTDVRVLTDAWCAAYVAAKGRKYMFSGAKDATAAIRLLGLGLPAEQVVALARRAWNHPDWFNCKHASTLSGFAARYNDIHDELDNPPDQANRRRRDNPHSLSGVLL